MRPPRPPALDLVFRLSVPGTPVMVTESFTIDIPTLEATSVDFGLLVDVSGSYGYVFSDLRVLRMK